MTKTTRSDRAALDRLADALLDAAATTGGEANSHAGIPR